MVAFFGIVAVLGMATPIHYGNGVILDGRSIILAVAGLMGGPVAALISSSAAAIYQMWLGGAGALAGVSVVASSSAIGVLFYRIRRRSGKPLGVLTLLVFGLSVHFATLALFQFMPDGIGQKIARDMGVTMILLCSLATILIATFLQDYEEKKTAHEDLDRLTYYDSLTALPNRSLLIEKLELSLESCSQKNLRGGLMLLNLDRFKTINDARGHASGDVLLRSVSGRLMSILDHGNILARTSADEFAILVVEPKAGSDPEGLFINELTGRIHASFRYPFCSGIDEVLISASIGAASFPQSPSDSVGDILRRADTAMHRAKQNGGNQTVVFDNSMAESAEERFHVERELRKAISCDQLCLYLQSQVNALGNIVGAEALIRWRHPERGVIGPASFIPIAEETDLIVAVGEWVMAEAFRVLSQAEMAKTLIRLSVNVSPVQFLQAGFVNFIRQEISNSGIDPNKLTLEITEGLLINNISEVISKMADLAAMGIHFSLDDFGTGYSSLSYLKRLPIHEIKIDKSFVQDAPVDADDAALVESVLAVARHMNVKVVAEGVETQQQADFLNARANVIHQGYLFGRPEPSDDWLARLR